MKLTKITASRLDDIYRQKDEYDSETAKLKNVVEEGENKYRKAVYDAKKDMEKIMSELIGPTSLDLEIHADPYGGGLFTKNDAWGIRVNANDRKKFNDDVALAWNWEVSIDNDGNVVKDSGSWSGLKAVTPEQIADLEESVRVIKLLNNIDWAEILNSPNPKWSDYIDNDAERSLSDRKRNRPNFENQISDARLEDMIGKNIAVKVKSEGRWVSDRGIIVTKLSDKFVTGYIFPWSFVDSKSSEEIKNFAGESRVAKDKIVGYGNNELITADLL